jgi:hypothetical protein
MNNPDRILSTLDRHLERPTRIILYGRAALALGFPSAPSDLAASLDVDALRSACDEERVPDIPELRVCFSAMQPRVPDRAARRLRGPA